MKISSVASGEKTPTTRGGDRRFTDLLNGDENAKGQLSFDLCEQKASSQGRGIGTISIRSDIALAVR